MEYNVTKKEFMRLTKKEIINHSYFLIDKNSSSENILCSRGGA